MLFRRLFYFEKPSFFTERTRFIEQSFSDKTNQIDEKLTIIFQTNETILSNRIERNGSVRNDEQRIEKSRKLYSQIMHSTAQ